MLVESVGTSIVVGKLRGGSLSNIKDASLEKWYFFVSGFLVEFAAVYMASKGAAFFRENILFIHGLSYMLLFIGIYFNRSILAFRIVFIGVFLNFIVIMANGGQMPVSGEAMEAIGLIDNMLDIRDGKIITHTLINNHTAFRYLGDIFVFAKPYPRPKIFSIGDVIMALGIFIYIQEIMKKKLKKERIVQYMK
ncbi:MAG: hypothetical protein APF77_11150 [Clostridia bacterium BRH_c25]|nr:MAG: hypothetical protein APF77_11150 [Clostridia bacterium BRH_c25]